MQTENKKKTASLKGQLSSRIKLFTVNSQYNKLERVRNRRNTNLYEVLSKVSSVFHQRNLIYVLLKSFNAISILYIQ